MLFTEIFRVNLSVFVGFHFWDFKNREEAESELHKHNARQKNMEDGLQAELIDDELTRSVCAFSRDKINQIKDLCECFNDVWRDGNDRN